MMELTYQNQMLMPASYAVLSEEEMTYIEGGAFAINITTADVLNFALNFTVNTIKVLGQGAFNSAWSGMKEMHDDGLTISGSIKHYWGRQTPAGKVGTVVVGSFAGFYVYVQMMQAINTVVAVYRDIKSIYEQSKAEKAAQEAAAAAIPDNTLAVA